MNIVQILMLGLMILITLVSGVVCVQTFKKQKKIDIKPILKQLCFVMVIGSLFNLAAACSGILSARPNIFIYMLWFATLILLLFCIYARNKNRTQKLEINRMFCEHKYIWIVLLISVVVRIFLIHDITVQRWDGGQYYYALGTGCQNYQFTLSSAWANFRLANHSTLGVSLLMGIGEFLNPRGVQGVLYVNLIMTIAAFYCIYELLRKYWMKLSDRQAAIGVLLVSVSPLILGTCGYFNVDYVMAMVFVFMIYCEYKQWNLLLFFWGAVLVQTKETGVFVFAGYFIGHFIYWMLKNKGSIVNKFVNVFFERITWATMGVALTYAIYVFKLGAFTAWSQYVGEKSQVLWSNTGMNCFGFQPYNIYIKCLQFFVLNFAWILVGILCILLIRVFIKHRKVCLSVDNMQGIYGGIGAFVSFSFLYITYDLERYNILFVLLFGLITYILCEKLFTQLNSGRVARMATWGVICILSFIQTFQPIDILSNKVFKLIDLGKGEMLFTSKSSDYFGDALINNYQYNWLEDALDLVFEEIEYNDKITVLFEGDHRYVGAHINGNPAAYYVFWDKEKNKRVMYQDENTCQINVSGEIDASSDNSDEVIAIFMSYYGFDEEKILSKYEEYYKISERHTVENYGGEIYYYRLLKKHERK